MSASPEEAIPPKPAKPRFADRPRWQRRNLSPTNGLIFLGILLTLVVVSALNYQAAWGLFSHGVILILEIAEQLMDMLMELIGMAPGAAQMVTAYVGVVVGLALFYFPLRKSMGWYQWISETIEDYRDMYVYLLKGWFRDIKADAITWWLHLDWLGKTFAIMFGLLVVVPLLLGLSVGLGMLVTMLF